MDVLNVEQWASKGAAEQLAYLETEGELDLPFIASLMRAAYGRGYVNSLTEPVPDVDLAVRQREILFLTLPVTA